MGGLGGLAGLGGLGGLGGLDEAGGAGIAFPIKHCNYRRQLLINSSSLEPSQLLHLTGARLNGCAVLVSPA